MKNWMLNMEGTPWWVLPVVILAGVAHELVENHLQARREAVPTIEPSECANSCHPYGLRALSPTGCECEVPSRYPAETFLPVVEPQDCAVVCGPGRVTSYSPTAGCACVVEE